MVETNEEIIEDNTEILLDLAVSLLEMVRTQTEDTSLFEQGLLIFSSIVDNSHDIEIDEQKVVSVIYLILQGLDVLVTDEYKQGLL